MIEEKFKFDRAKSKNNIAENSFALGHERQNTELKKLTETVDKELT